MSSACSTRRDRWLVFLVMLVMLALVACLAPPEAEEDAGTAAVAFAGSGSGSGSTDPLPEPIVDAGVDDARMDDASLSPDAGCVAQPEPTCAAAPPGASPRDPGIPGGGQCRGACGAACPATCRTLPAVTICHEWQTADCRWHAKVCTYDVIECGSHAGCRTHDACYDACVGSFFPAGCRRRCDLDCVVLHGADRCAAWMNGDPPYDSWLPYASAPAVSSYDSTCY